MSKGPFTQDEFDTLRIFVDSGANHFDVASLARSMGRHPSAINNHLRVLRERPRIRHELPGVMIDDFGLSHAQLMRELREGRR